MRRRYLIAELARTIAIEIANATFAARTQQVWGAGSTAVASDSTCLLPRRQGRGQGPVHPRS